MGSQMRQIAVVNSQPSPRRIGAKTRGLAGVKNYIPRTSICCLGKEGAGGSIGKREALRELPNTYLVMMMVVVMVQGS